MTPNDVLQLLETQHVQAVDLRFLDYPGTWQSLSIPADRFTAEAFKQGIGFDGSCIRGWAEVNEGDMLLVPVAETAHLDAFTVRPTLGLICDIKDPVTKKRFSRDPRSIARKAQQHLEDSGIADTGFFSPEVEFFVFDGVRFGQTSHHAVVELESAEGLWSRIDKHPLNDGYQVPVKTGQFPAPPTDHLHDLRAEMVAEARAIGLDVEHHHHEVATGGQCEIGLAHQPLVTAADHLVLLKHVVRNVAARHGKSATFMPKPLFGDNGSGLHTHFSLLKAGQNLLAGTRYAGLSPEGLHAIAGILKHGPALAALLAPPPNSYHRRAPGDAAPGPRLYASRNRAAAVRVPVYSDNPQTKRLEVRIPDPACNPYLAYSALTMAALDGIRCEYDPGEPFDRPLEKLDDEAYANLPRLPLNLDGALDALESDHGFLTQGHVFTNDLIRFWIMHKRRDEIGAIQDRPHPHEFELYYTA